MIIIFNDNLYPEGQTALNHQTKTAYSLLRYDLDNSSNIIRIILSLFGFPKSNHATNVYKKAKPKLAVF